LTEGLVELGHDVTLFATADSITSARLVSIAPRGYSEDPGIDAKVWECLHVAKLFECASDFDLIHNSYDFLPLSYSRLIGTPVVTTIHGFSSERILPVYQEYAANNHYVSISDADRHTVTRIRGNDPSRHRHDGIRTRSRVSRVSAVLRAHSPRQGN
jgi:hypothetical protein